MHMSFFLKITTVANLVLLKVEFGICKVEVQFENKEKCQARYYF